MLATYEGEPWREAVRKFRQSSLPGRMMWDSPLFPSSHMACNLLTSRLATQSVRVHRGVDVGSVRAFHGSSRHLGLHGIVVGSILVFLGSSRCWALRGVAFGRFWVRRDVWAFVLLRLARFRRFVVHRDVRDVVGWTSAFPGSLRGYVDAGSIWAFRVRQGDTPFVVLQETKKG
jgi:hypothetical protein